MLVITPTINRFGQQQINACFAQGDLIAWTFLLAIGGIPINLTGASVKMTIAMRAPLLLTTENGGITMLDAVKGQFIANIPSNVTAGFIPGTYNYDVWVQQNVASTPETQYITGNVTVNQSTSVFP